MAFKTYCWSIGTTSFRVSQLNYKVERQLQLLKEFWNINPNIEWNPETQTKYYNYLKENQFVQGEANRPDKDAREKTSGLVDIGVLTKDRKLTDVGINIEKILYEPRNKDNIFNIDNDSYQYLLQFLKMQRTEDGLKIKPFIAFIYMLEKLDYLTYDEFTYLLPLCKNKNDVIKMVDNIKLNRQGFDIDEIITSKIYDMSNYLQAWEYFRTAVPVTKETFEKVGMNRKSASYEHPYFDLYNELVNLSFHLRHNSFEERVESYNKLYNYCKKLSGNAKGHWINYLFMGYNPRNIDEAFDKKFRQLELSEVKNIIDFKRCFFDRMHIIKWKVNLKEYFDLNRRYFSLTDIVRFEDDKIELDMLPKYYFKDIIDDLLNEDLISDDEYLILFHSNVALSEISPKYNINISDIVNNVNKDLGTTLTVNNINNYIKDEKLKHFIELIDKKYKTQDLIRLLSQIKNRNDSEINSYVTDNATVPTIFEYVLGIAWYRISEMKGNILDYMNLSLDADFLPKTHAGGGMADIVYKYEQDVYPKHDLLIEATLSESTGQRVMEMEPVSRHLGENIKITNNENDYALFVAPQLEERIILDFRNMKTRYYPKGNGEFINGLKIIPIDIDMVINLLENNVKYSSIYEWFDKAYKSVVPDPIWYEKEILNN